MKMREEKDVFGRVLVPYDRLWGSQTQRCLNKFKIGAEALPAPVVKALATVKKAAARANNRLGLLTDDLAEAIDEAAQSIIDGQYLNEFPVPPWQTGSGTHSNMNANEVIANLANRNLGHPIGLKYPVHPNDHVNLSQSSNDTFPSAMHIAFVTETHQKLLPALTGLSKSLRTKQKQYENTLKLGRTHFQDAVPMVVAQEIGAWASQLEFSHHRIENTLKAIYQLAQGGTAIGTGLNTPYGFDRLVCEAIAEITGFPFIPVEDKFAAIAAHDALVCASGDLNQLATVMLKLSNDIKILSSGPRAGLAEMILPANEPGSSIMPGKVNPTQAEALAMVACQVMGNHQVVSIAASQGQLQLNAFKPVIILNLLRSIELISDVLASFKENCVEGLSYDEERLTALMDNTLMVVTALTPVIGYDKCAEIAQKAHQERKTLKQAALDLDYLTAVEFDKYVQPNLMLKPFPV